MNREKQMIDDLTEIFDEEYEKRNLITPKNTAEKMTAKGYRKQEWISVNERLPDREGKYLAYTTRGTVEMARCYTYHVDDKPQFDYWITHWMPLPEAPKMKGGAE